MHLPVSLRRAILNRKKKQTRRDFMRALVYRNARLVLDRNYPMPALVDGEALIRVTHAGICNTDLEIVRGYMGFQGVLGHEFVGIVEDIYGEIAADYASRLIGQRVVGD